MQEDGELSAAFLNAVAKPIGGKPYASISHLPHSANRSEGDKALPAPSVAKLSDPEDGARLYYALKVDGTNVAVANVGGELAAVQRSGYPCDDSPYQMHRNFAAYVRGRERAFRRCLPEPGMRLCGEWIATTHGIRYRYASPFLAFDLIGDTGGRLSYSVFADSVRAAGLLPVPYFGSAKPVSEKALSNFFQIGSPSGLEGHCSAGVVPGSHGLERITFPIELEPDSHGHEGYVVRYERDDVYKFSAKYVSPGFVPGAFLPGIARPAFEPTRQNKFSEFLAFRVIAANQPPSS